jgi:hypothetical protein
MASNLKGSTRVEAKEKKSIGQRIKGVAKRIGGAVKRFFGRK